MDVIDTETTIQETELKLGELVNKIEPIEGKLKEIKSVEANLATYDTKLGKLKVKLDHCRKHEGDLKKDIKNLFEGTLPELKEKITNFDATVKAKQKELKESYTKISKFNDEEEKVANEIQSNKLKLEKLDVLESQNEKKVLERNEMIGTVAKTAGLEDIPTVGTNEEAENAMTAISDKIKSLEKEESELKAIADREEQEKQALVDESREAMVCHKQQISTKSSDIAKNKREVVKLEREINSANQSKVRLEAAEQKFKTAEEEYEELEKELNTEETQQNINEGEKELEKHEQEVDEVDKKISVLQKQSAKLKELQVKEDLLKQKEKQCSTLKNKHRSTLTDLLGSMPESNFVISLNKLEVTLNSEVTSLKKSLSDKKTEKTKLEEERKYVRKNLTERTNEHTKAEEQMYKVCSGQSYETTLLKVCEKVENLQDEHNELQSSMFLIKSYEAKLKKESCCPLCSRGFDSESEITDLITQLNTKVMTVPTQLERVSADLSKEKEKKDELLSMKSLNEKMNLFKQKEKPELDKQLANVEAKITTLNNAIDEVTKSLIEPEKKLQSVKLIQGDMPLLDRCIQEIASYTKNYESIKAQCSGLESDMTLEEATAKQTELKKKISDLKAKLKDTQKKLNLHNKKIQEHATRKNKLKEECLNLQKKVQEIYNLQETKKQLETDREKYELELVELRNGLKPLEDAVKEKNEAKNTAVSKNRGNIEIKKSEITNVTFAFEKVKSIDTEIRQHSERNIPLEKSKKEEAVKKLEEKLKQIQSDRQAITKRIECLNDEITKETIYKRELDDNLKLRGLQKDITDGEKEEAEINEKLSTINRDIINEKKTLTVSFNNLNKEKSETDGTLRTLQTTLKKQKADLKVAQGKDTEKKYREKFYELHITKMLDKDVKEYSAVLQNCLMEYHKKKMESINLIIRELWNKIYSGNDIDYIAIKAEGSMSADSERCKYEYRVVQCKNGIEIDMRGRCSAGQKVLACLIIRLALAETFSSRFGVLALDEPTTNLDEENIKNLCTALGEIVQERKLQKNFMFIIITHDREFIESLGQIDKVTHFYEVSRNEDGKSRIKKLRFT